MMKKILSMLVLLAMLLAVWTGAMAVQNQITYQGGTRWYGKDGNMLTVNGAFTSNSNAWVEMSKTIEATGVENEFIVTMDVKTKQDIKTLSSETPDAATVLVIDVSNSMNLCVECGKDLGGNQHTGKNAQCSVNKSRMEQAKSAAIEFVRDFGKNTGAIDDDKRMVAVVLYGSDAWSENQWYDVATASGLTAAENYINSIEMRNGSNDTYKGGTNFEAGLMLAKNVINDGRESGGEINGIDYLYTILLTDGEPTYHVDGSSNSTTNITGKVGGSNKTNKEDAKDVGTQAEAIRAIGGKGLSKLYSICMGEDLWTEKAFGNWSDAKPATTDQTTIGQWLSAFSTAAYDGEATNLFDSFDAVMYQIQLAAKAWRVADWMGDQITYLGKVDIPNSAGNGTIHNSVIDHPTDTAYADASHGMPDYVWNILGSEATHNNLVQHANGTVSGYVGYTYKYKVRLENQHLAYHNALLAGNGSVEVNDLATLKYAVTDAQGNWPANDSGLYTAEFLKPEVIGLLGELEFDKVDQHGDKIHGDITFRLRADHSAHEGEQSEAVWEYAEATTDENGHVIFHNVPSGHDYTLIEAETDFDDNYNYVDSGDIHVDVDWGEAKPHMTDLDHDGVAELVNTLTDYPLATIVLEKAFGEGSEIPASIKMLITGRNSQGDVISTYERVLRADDAKDGVWTWAFTDLEPSLKWTVEELNAQDANGNPLKDKYNLVWKVSVNGKETEPVAFVQGNTATYPVTPEQIEIARGGSATVRFTNTMTRKVGSLTVGKAYEGLPQGVQGAPVTITVTPADGSAAQSIELPVNGSWTYTFTGLPIGNYTVTESAMGDIGNYRYVYNEFVSGGVTESNAITVGVAADAQTQVAVTNHYEEKLGTVVVTKDFPEGSDLQGNGAVLANKVIEATLYKPDGSQETIKLSQENNWTRIFPNMPLGEYRVVENISSAQVDHHTLEVSYEPMISGKEGAGAVLVDDDEDRVVLDIWNTYTQETDTITVRKTFTGDLDGNSELMAGMEFTVTIKDAQKNTVGTLTLNKANGWTATSEHLAHGETYTLEETGGQIANYDWTPAITINGQSSTSVELLGAAHADIVNNYVVHKGSALIEKTMEGIDAAHMPQKITVILTNTETQADYVVELKASTIADQNWKALLVNLPVGEYTVKEGADAQVDGYNMKATFKAGNDTLSENETFEITKDTQISVSIENEYEKKTGMLEVTKAFGSGMSDNLKALADAKTYTVFVLDENGAEVAELELTKDNDWKASAELPLGTYTLLEESDSAQIDGYTLHVSYSGAAEVKSNRTANATVTNSYTVKNGTLELIKHNVGNPARMPQSISFSITAGVGDTESGMPYSGMETLSAANNWTIMLSLEPGVYTVTEVTDDETTSITWTGDGLGGQTVSGKSVRVTVEHEETATVICTNDYEYFHDLTFYKRNSYNDSPMNGVEFTLTHKDHNEAGSQTCTDVIEAKTAESDSNGKVTFTGIEAGHAYTLTEKAVNGFTTMAPQTVTVSDYGITVTGDLLDHVVYNTRTDWPTQDLEFTKQNVQGGQPIEGIEFALKHSPNCPDCSGQPAAMLDDTWTAASNNEGKVSIAGLPVKHTYILEETKHDGYLHAGPWTVTVTENGTTLEGDGVPQGAKVIVNEPTDYEVTKISFKKYSSYTNAPLQGVVFTLRHSADCAYGEGWPAAFSTTMTATSAADGTVEFVNVPTHHTYILSEAAPDGYIGMSPKTLVVEKDSITGFEQNSIVYNQLETWPVNSFTFKKHSSVDNMPIAGIGFTLTHDASCQSCVGATQLGLPVQPSDIMDEGWNRTATSNANGVVEFTNVPVKHRYILTETNSLDYEAMSPKVVRVAENNVLIEGLSDNTIYNVPKQDKWPLTTISFYKHSTYTQGALPGVTFTLEHHADCRCAGLPAGFTNPMTVSSGELGLVEFADVPEGHVYLLSEQKPEGYAQIGPWEVHVYTQNYADANGLEKIQGLPVAIGGILYNNLETWPTLPLSFHKHSRLTNGPIEGIEFTIAHSCEAGKCIGLPEGIANKKWTATSDVDGLVAFDGLPVKHTYTLEETKHEGYIGVEKMIVTVTDTTVLVDGKTPDGLIVYNVPTEWPLTSLSFYKYSNYTKAALEGVKFTLTHSDDCEECSHIPAEIETPKEAVSDPEGLVKFDEIPVNHTYVISENEAPAGYAKMADLTVTVTQDENGVTITGLENGSVIYNMLEEWPKENITFTKISAFDGRVLAGATFDLVHIHDAQAENYCCAEVIDIAEATTDIYGKVTLTDVPRQHIYVLTETKAPEGYKVIAPVVVRVIEGEPIMIGGEQLVTGFAIKDDPTYWPVEIQLTASKTMNGEVPTDEYTFVISSARGEIERVKNVAGTITFSKYLFEKPGRYEFEICELAGEDPTVIYDSAVYTAIVNVKADAEGKMSAQVSLKKNGLAHEGDIEFANMNMPTLPETGDNSQMALWCAMLAMAGLGIVLMKRKRA